MRGRPWCCYAVESEETKVVSSRSRILLVWWYEGRWPGSGRLGGSWEKFTRAGRGGSFVLGCPGSVVWTGDPAQCVRSAWTTREKVGEKTTHAHTSDLPRGNVIEDGGSCSGQIGCEWWSTIRRLARTERTASFAHKHAADRCLTA